MPYNLKDKNIPDSMYSLLTTWQGSSKNFDAKILIYLASEYFNIHRLPTYIDRQLITFDNQYIDKYFGKSASEIDKKINSLLTDFELMYKDTQRRLREKYKNKQILTLSRRIVQKNEIDNKGNLYNSWNCKLFPSSTTILDPTIILDYIRKEKEHKRTIQLEMDILNSWAEIPSDVYGIIKFSKEIPLEDIIFFNEYSDHTGPLEFDEYLVINKSRTGIIEIPYQNLEIDEEIFRPIKNNMYHQEIRRLYVSPSSCAQDKKVNKSLCKELWGSYKYWKKYK